MSLDTLLEAAKYIEYRAEAKARGEEPKDYYTFAKLCSARKDAIYQPPPPVEYSSPKKQQPIPSSPHSSEETKEKKRPAAGLNKEPSALQEHPGTGTREVHNKLEKNRRAHLKECFEALKKQIPNMDDRKTSNLSILRGALRFIQVLKRKERDYEHDMERLAREKIAFQQRLSSLKKELSSHLDHIDTNNSYPIKEEDNETTTTASECGALSDFDDSEPLEASTMTSAATSDFASSSSSSTASTVLVGPLTTTASASPLALTKQTISGAQLSTLKEAATSSNLYLSTLDSGMTVESKAPMLSSVPSPAQLSNENSAQTRVHANERLKCVNAKGINVAKKKKRKVNIIVLPKTEK